MERELSPTKLILKGVTGWVGSYFGRTDEGAMEGIEAMLESLGLDGNSGMEEQDDMEGMGRSGYSAEGGIWLGEIGDELENKYLTMSWWLLHVGWKDVGERVRRAAEEVFNGYVFISSAFCGQSNPGLLQCFFEDQAVGNRSSPTYC